MDLALRSDRFIVAVALAGAIGPPALAATWVVAKDGVEVSILPAVGAASANQSLVRVSLDVEAKSEAAAQRLGFRSLRGVTDVDCRTGENQFVRAEAFDHADLRGEGRAWPVLGAWGRPTGSSYMFAVTQRVCGKAALQAAGPPPVVTAAAGPTPAGIGGSATEGVADSPAPQARSTPPIHLEAHNTDTADSATADEGASTDAAPEHAAPEHVAMGPPPARAPARPPAAAIARPAQATGARQHAPGPLAAQIAAGASAAGAQHALDALRSLIAPPLAGVVETAEANGAKVYRATVTGFVSPAEARSFCARAGLKSCWVRASAGKPPV